jgi:phosphonoacetaldehyde hydrolase
MGLMKKDHLRAMCQMDSVSTKWRETHGRPPEESDVEAMFKELEPLMASSIAAYSDPIPGAVKALEDLRRRGIKVGSTTGYTQPIMEVLTRSAEERGYHPDCIVCPSDVPTGRPSPFMCYLNAIRLEVYPLQAIVKVGDTIADIEEGVNSGLWTVGVTRTGSELGLSEKEVQQMDPEALKWKLAAVGKRFLDAGAHEVIEGIWEVGRIIDEFNRRLAAGERP